MSNPERLKELLAEAKSEAEKMESWMTSQEPTPGDSYEDWIQEVQKTVEPPKLATLV